MSVSFVVYVSAASSVTSIATFNAWAPSEVISNPALHRTFSQVLYALVNDGKVLAVIPVFFGTTILFPVNTPVPNKPVPNTPVPVLNLNLSPHTND